MLHRIKNHLCSCLDMPEGYLTFCEGVISSTGTPVIKRNTSDTDKRVTNKTEKQEMCLRSVRSKIVDE